MPFKKILVPHDGSAMSGKALEKAVEIAKLIKGSQIIAMYVIPDVTTSIFERAVRNPKTGKVTSFTEHMTSLHRELKSAMIEKLEERKRKYGSNGVPVRIFITNGSPSDKIVEYATKEKIELIVIGSMSIRGISKFFKGLGSVSRSVSERVSCCVMIVSLRYFAELESLWMF